MDFRLALRPRSSCLSHLSVRMIITPRTPGFEGDVSSCLAHEVAVKFLRMEDLARQQCLASSAAHSCRETQGGQCREGSYRAGLSSLVAQALLCVWTTGPSRRKESWWGCLTEQE